MTRYLVILMYIGAPQPMEYRYEMPNEQVCQQTVSNGRIAITSEASRWNNESTITVMFCATKKGK